jgi:adenylosuccinate lyase
MVAVAPEPCTIGAVAAVWVAAMTRRRRRPDVAL